MQSQISALADFEIAHLYPQRGFVMVGTLGDLRAEALEAVPDDAAPVAYRSTHGGVIAATEDVFRLLDTFLEKRLVKAFGWLEERKHWDDEDGELLPAGPGPYGSGIRALGSDGASLDLAAIQHGPPLDLSRLPVEDEADEDTHEGEESDDDAPHAREPWHEVIGDGAALQEWLCRQMRWSMNDGVFTEYPQTERERALLVETQISRRELAERLLTAFPPENSRYFSGGNAGWDRWGEDFLSRNEVIGFVSGDHVAIMWLEFYRFYG